MKFCEKCGAQMPDEALCCTNCGAPLQASQVPNQPYQQQSYQQQPYQQQPYQQQPYQQQPMQQPYQQPYQQQYQPVAGSNVNNKALASLLLGIGGLACVLLAPFLANFPAFIGLVISIIGIVIGVKARNELPVGHPNRSMATGGLVCSIIGTIIGGIATLCTVCVCTMASCLAIGAASDSSWLSEYGDYLTILFR